MCKSYRCLETNLSNTMALLVHSPGWVNRYTTESIENLLSFNAIPYAHQVSPTPLLIDHGKNDKYCLPKFAQQVYDLAENSKEILWLDTTNHIDLYYNEKMLVLHLPSSWNGSIDI